MMAENSVKKNITPEGESIALVQEITQSRGNIGGVSMILEDERKDESRVENQAAREEETQQAKIRRRKKNKKSKSNGGVNQSMDFATYKKLFTKHYL